MEEEFTARAQRRLQRLIAQADFKPEGACLENVLASPTRGLDQLTLARFTSDTWITQATNVILTGATGVGKTYVAEAIGLQACRCGYAVRKLRYTHLFEEIHAARGTGCLLKYLSKLQATSVLILDDFLMAAVPADDLTYLLEVIEERAQVSSLILTTQYPVAEWHRLLPDPTLADAICDRWCTLRSSFACRVIRCASAEPLPKPARQPPRITSRDKMRSAIRFFYQYLHSVTSRYVKED